MATINHTNYTWETSVGSTPVVFFKTFIPLGGKSAFGLKDWMFGFNATVGGRQVAEAFLDNSEPSDATVEATYWY